MGRTLQHVSDLFRHNEWLSCTLRVSHAELFHADAVKR